MRTWAHVVVLIGTGSILAACSGSQPPLGESSSGLPSQQSMAHRVFHIIHPFGRSARDGTKPAADLIDVKGTLYGTTSRGGAHGAGTVFSITTGGQETLLHSFGAGKDGAVPLGKLLNVNGTLYGTTAYGGGRGGGTVFRMALTGKEDVLYNFATDYPYRENSGSVPVAGLIDVKGILYGTTSHGGTRTCDTDYEGCGTVFTITRSGKETVLRNFGEDEDGIVPLAALVNVGGTLYGTTSTCSGLCHGTVFSITPAGQYQTVYTFGTQQNDGDTPSAALIDVNGTLYGTTAYGGGNGNVFSVTPSGTETVIYNFSGSDGSEPLAALKNVDGVLYGTTASGGANNYGTVFSISKTGIATVVHSFAKGDGVNPVASVIAVDHTLYGTTFGSTTYGAKRSFGNVYSLTP
jgi:uncharacterized repeat protein (TIGR03803 family)